MTTVPEAPPLLVNCQYLIWVGSAPSKQDRLSNWEIIRAWTIDHNNEHERIELGRLCREAFLKGDRIHTWGHHPIP